MFTKSCAGKSLRVHICYSDRHFNPWRQNPDTTWFSCAQIAAQTFKAFTDAGFNVSYADQVPAEPIDVLWTNRLVSRGRNVGRMVYFASVAHFGFVREALAARTRYSPGREDLGYYSASSIYNYNKTLFQSDKIVVIGNHTILGAFTSILPEISKRLLLVDCGVDCLHFAPSENFPRRPDFVHTATHLSYRKGTNFIAAAWPDVASRLPGSRLVLLGRPGDFSPPPELTGRQDVTMSGAFQNGNKSYTEMLTGCRWAVLPSVAEGQAGTLLEAMSCGCMPVATRETGIDAERYSGVVIGSHSKEAVRDAMLRAAAEWKAGCADSVRTSTAVYHNWELFRERLQTALIEVSQAPPLADTTATATVRSLRYTIRRSKTLSSI